MRLPRPLPALLVGAVLLLSGIVLLATLADTWTPGRATPREDRTGSAVPPASGPADGGGGAPTQPQETADTDRTDDASWGQPREGSAAALGTVVLTDRGELDLVATVDAARHVDAGRVHPGLAAALERARRDAAAAGVTLPVSSDYRSADEQAANLADAIVRHGSLEQALHWVFPPDRSMHVRGLAIDLNSGPGADWLQIHGARFGLCKTLAWEWWHFEWRERWEAASACPPPAGTPAEAPGP